MLLLVLSLLRMGERYMFFYFLFFLVLSQGMVKVCVCVCVLVFCWWLVRENKKGLISAHGGCQWQCNDEKGMCL
jgi:hypothetical protein